MAYQSTQHISLLNVKTFWIFYAKTFEISSVFSPTIQNPLYSRAQDTILPDSSYPVYTWSNLCITQCGSFVYSICPLLGSTYRFHLFVPLFTVNRRWHIFGHNEMTLLYWVFRCIKCVAQTEFKTCSASVRYPTLPQGEVG